MDALRWPIPESYLQDRFIIAISLLLIVSICFGFAFDLPWIGLIIPTIVIGGYLLLFHLHWVYRILFLLIPFSMELELPGGLGTDIPGEPLLWVMSAVTLFLILIKGLPSLACNTISMLLFAHLTWILCASIFAIYPVIAFKYSAAKLWYILPFYLLPFYLIRNIISLRIILKYFALGTLVASIYFFIQHASMDLSYLSRTNAGQPIWRNHVNYACTLVLNLPILWYLYRSSSHPDRWMYVMWSLLLWIFIYFAFTRIAYLAIIVSIIYVFVLKWRITKLTIGLSLISILILVAWLFQHNQYVHLAPQYDKTIMQIDFENKISATAQGRDISTMERLHRWVAGANMIQDRPLSGFGPANFYRTYRPYTIYSFETYVSHNPEHSGIHNYFLMLLVEQGYIGLSIFLLIIFITMIKIEKAYHLHREMVYKDLFMMAGCILVMIITINAVNDMIEVIKIGGVFFLILYVVESRLSNHKQLNK